MTFNNASANIFLEPSPIDEDGEEFAAYLTEGLAPVIQILKERYTKTRDETALRLKKTCNEQEKERQKDVTKLREEITRLTLRLHAEEERSIRQNVRLASRNEKIAHNHKMKNVPKIHGKHVMAIWRQFAAKKKICDKNLKIFMLKSRTKIKRNCFSQWCRFHLNGIKKKGDAKLNAITREIISRYESELVQLRSELMSAHEEINRGKALRQQLEDRMRRTLLQGMTAMNMETLTLFNEVAKSDSLYTMESAEGQNGT